MKALDTSHPSFHAPLKATVTFKTLNPNNLLNGRSVARPSAPQPTAARTSAHPAVPVTAARRANTASKTAFDELEIRVDLEPITPKSSDAVGALYRELVSEFGPTAEVKHPLQNVANSNAVVSQSGAVGAKAAANQNDLRGLYALRLVEKISSFMRTESPAIAMTLNNALAARVDVERVGRSEVAITVTGHRGPPSPESVTRIRDEMEAHGLKIAVLSVA